MWWWQEGGWVLRPRSSATRCWRSAKWCKMSEVATEDSEGDRDRSQAEVGRHDGHVDVLTWWRGTRLRRLGATCAPLPPFSGPPSLAVVPPYVLVPVAVHGVPPGINCNLMPTAAHQRTAADHGSGLVHVRVRVYVCTNTTNAHCRVPWYTCTYSSTNKQQTPNVPKSTTDGKSQTRLPRDLELVTRLPSH